MLVFNSPMTGIVFCVLYFFSCSIAVYTGKSSGTMSYNMGLVFGYAASRIAAATLAAFLAWMLSGKKVAFGLAFNIGIFAFWLHQVLSDFIIWRLAKLL